MIRRPASLAVFVLASRAAAMAASDAPPVTNKRRRFGGSAAAAAEPCPTARGPARRARPIVVALDDGARRSPPPIPRLCSTAPVRRTYSTARANAMRAPRIHPAHPAQRGAPLPASLTSDQRNGVRHRTARSRGTARAGTRLAISSSPSRDASMDADRAIRASRLRRVVEGMDGEANPARGDPCPMPAGAMKGRCRRAGADVSARRSIRPIHTAMIGSARRASGDREAGGFGQGRVAAPVRCFRSRPPAPCHDPNPLRHER